MKLLRSIFTITMALAFATDGGDFGGRPRV